MIKSDAQLHAEALSYSGLLREHVELIRQHEFPESTHTDSLTFPELQRAYTRLFNSKDHAIKLLEKEITEIRRENAASEEQHLANQHRMGIRISQLRREILTFIRKENEAPKEQQGQTFNISVTPDILPVEGNHMPNLSQRPLGIAYPPKGDSKTLIDTLTALAGLRALNLAQRTRERDALKIQVSDLTTERDRLTAVLTREQEMVKSLKIQKAQDHADCEVDITSIDLSLSRSRILNKKLLKVIRKMNDE